ncbi:MAG: family 1 encapsulin nanocompartment shell protein [Methanoregula sp.]
MENKYLGRGDAPITAETWALLDKVMVESAKSQLVGRRILPIEGPYGLGLKSISLGDYVIDDGIVGSASVPVTMIRTDFSLAKRDLAAFERDHLFLDTAPVACAAMDCAAKEDQVLLSGLPGIPGLMNVAGAGSFSLSKWEKVGTAADQIIDAVTKLDEAGFHGPYSMALAPSLFNLLLRRYPQGAGTELDHIRSIVTDGVVKAPNLKKGGVLLASGKQYVSVAIGQDMVLGYNGPVGDLLEFQIYESLALMVHAPQSICVLK